MLKLERSVISVVARRFRSRAVVELENLALRHQLHVLRRQRPGRLRLFTFDRLLYRLWPRCLEAMVLVKPATVIQWHRQGFRLFWRWRSRSGRPSVDREVRDLTARAHRRGLGRTDRTSSALDRARTRGRHLLVAQLRSLLHMMAKTSRPESSVSRFRHRWNRLTYQQRLWPRRARKRPESGFLRCRPTPESSRNRALFR